MSAYRQTAELDQAVSFIRWVAGPYKIAGFNFPGTVKPSPSITLESDLALQLVTGKRSWVGSGYLV